jgi:hypothetical protein
MIAAVLAVLALAAPVQQAREARVTITVVDQTGAVIPNARVTVAPAAEAKPAAPGEAPAAAGREPAMTNDKGIATIGGLTAGRFNISAEFPGFETRVLKDVPLRAGDNKHAVVLAIQGLQDSVTVSRDAREAASDRRSTFGTALTREQIEALSDDPDEMAQQLKDLAGSDAVLRIDSFEGGLLPPKAALKAIHITRDAFAAENHYAGGLFVDIITQPGIGPVRTNMGVRLRDGSMSGRPPAAFAEGKAKGPERYQNYNGGLSGSLIKQKASFSVNFSGGRNYDTPYFYYMKPDRTWVNGLAPRRPRDTVFVFGMFDYAITRDQTLRIHFSRDKFTSKNIGVGGFNVLERAYSTDDSYNNVRIQEAGPLGRRFFINTRASLNWGGSSSRSVFEGGTISVPETFTTGGAQRRGSVRNKSLNLQSDLDYVRGIHSWRTGIAIDAGSYRSNDESNYLGTYTFESFETFLAGTPRSYTQRIGDPNIRYRNLQAGWYLQDDIRVRKNLTLSPGIRYEAQTHLSDYDNVGPRFGATWSPGKGGKLTLRASAGVFYDWLFTNIYEQTIRVDGFRQREVNIVNPSYPDPGSLDGLSLPTNRYLLADGLQMQRNFRLSAGFSRPLTKMLTVNATYAHTSGDNLMRGRNLNAPVNGVRPDPLFANVVEVLGDAESRAHSLNIGASVNFNVASSGPSGPMMMGPGVMIMTAGGAPPPPPPPGTRPTPANARWNWRRMSLFTNVFLGRTMNNTDGAFTMPATGRIEDDWGPSSGDVRSRVNIGWSSQQLRGLNANINVNASTAPPYTIRSGFDTNGDLAFTDRPDGVGRNTERGSGQWTMNGNFSYSWLFGKPVERAGGISIRSEGGGLTASQGAASTQGRYRLSLNASVQNLTNHHNLIGYIGTRTADRFGQPSSFSGTRKIDFGLSLSF